MMGWDGTQGQDEVQKMREGLIANWPVVDRGCRDSRFEVTDNNSASSVGRNRNNGRLNLTFRVGWSFQLT